MAVLIIDRYIGLFGTGFMQVLYLGRAPRTNETLPDFLKWRRVTRHPLVFRGLTGSQQTPGFGASQLSTHVVASVVVKNALKATPLWQNGPQEQKVCASREEQGSNQA